MFRSLGIAAVVMALSTGGALADGIEGNWKTAAGSVAAIADCGGAFCITLKNGKHAGKRIGRLKASGGGKYDGQITDPADDKTYAGSARLSGASLKLTGCALKIFCKSQTWQKQ